VLSGEAEIVVASPSGGKAPLDPSSVEAASDDPVSQRMLNGAVKPWEQTEKLSGFRGRAHDFAAIFFVGGHGPMFDLADNSTSHAIVNEFAAANRIVAAVCHGPAALARVKDSSGASFLADVDVTGFSDDEEAAVGLASAMPFSLEQELRRASGGRFVKAEQPWHEKVVVERGGRLILGQNPASAKGVGEAILRAIKEVAYLGS
jgi:putative intracellular protease/amidase